MTGLNPQILNIMETLRQELWRGLARLEAAEAADMARDEALAVDVAAVAEAASGLRTAMEVERALDARREIEWSGDREMEQLGVYVELGLMYFSTARAMAAFGLATLAFSGSGSVVGRVAALLLAILLDAGVVLIVAAPAMANSGLVVRLGGCWRRWRRPARRAAVVEAEEGPGPVDGGWMGYLSNLLWARAPTSPAADQADSPV